MLFLLSLLSLLQFFTIHIKASEALNLFGKKAMSSASGSLSSAAKSRLVYGKDDSLFGLIEEKQGKAPFGNFLDAGTG